MFSLKIPFRHNILKILIIYALLTRNVGVKINALFPQIFLGWRANSADLFTFRMYVVTFRLWRCFVSGVPQLPTTPSPTTSTCSTIDIYLDGPECSFPFVFKGHTWTGCTTVDGDQPWCPTQTDADGNPIIDGDGTFSAWGYCHSSCPIDQGLTFLLRQELLRLIGP